MLLPIIRCLLSVFTFWFPLALSTKALDSRDVQGIQFLLTFWLYYVVIAHAQFYVRLYDFPLANLCCLGGDFVKMWMFYAHGCLVISAYYVPALFGHTLGSYTVMDFEKLYVDPLVSTFVTRNPVLQNFLVLIRGVRLPGVPISDLLRFNYELRKMPDSPKKPSFLQFGLDYFCYIDLSSALYARYQEFRRFLFGVSQVILPPPRKRSLSGVGRIPLPRGVPSRVVLPRLVVPRVVLPRSGLPRAPLPSGSFEHNQFIDSRSTPRLKTYTVLANQTLWAEHKPKPRAVSGSDVATEPRVMRTRASSFSAGDPPYPIVSELPVVGDL